MKISFDFDNTLTKTKIQKIASKFINNGHNVYVTTSRFTTEIGTKNNWHWIKDQNLSLFKITDKLGISRDHIQFTCMEPKYLFLNDFDLHFDDDIIELDMIEDYLDKCIGMLICTKELETK